jgi:glutamyl-Q tRNA(Asp) synthetase
MLLNEMMAKEMGGRLLLRIEDTDTTRCKTEYIEAIHEDLRWLGIAYEEPVRIQSEHFAEYEAALHKLWEHGHIYPCFCSRKHAKEEALRTTDPDGQPHYGGTCRALAHQESEYMMQSGQPYGWRLKTNGTSARIWGDVTIAKPKTGSWYHIAVVVDDALQGITHVVRGQDMEAATPIHQLLQKRLNLPTPNYHHHTLIRDDEGLKLSKSLKSKSLRAMREAGITADQIRTQFSFSVIPAKAEVTVNHDNSEDENHSAMR